MKFLLLLVVVVVGAGWWRHKKRGKTPAAAPTAPPTAQLKLPLIDASVYGPGYGQGPSALPWSLAQKAAPGPYRSQVLPSHG
jgi:hypothetical protein